MCVCVCVCARVCVHCTSVYIIIICNIVSGPTISGFGIQSCIRCTLAWCTAIFVNSTTELGLSQMRVKGLDAVCKRSLQLFRGGPVVPEAEELQRRIQAASTEERRRRLKCTVL